MGLMNEWKYLIATAVGVVLLNTVAIAVCFKTRKERRKSTTSLLISLLASDSLFGAILIPTRIIEIWYSKNAVFPYIYAYILFLSVFNTLFLSFDRYASVIKPLWRRLISTNTIIKGLVITWIAPCIISLLPLTWVYTSADGYRSNATNVYRYILVSLLCSVLVSIFILQVLVLLGLVKYWIASKKKAPLFKIHGRGSNPKKKFKRKLISTILFTSLIVTSVVTWLPTIVYNIVPYPVLVYVSLFALMANAVCDPLLIIGFNARVIFNKRGDSKRSQTTLLTGRQNNMLVTQSNGADKERKKQSFWDRNIFLTRGMTRKEFLENETPQ